ncbi:hypothetical protein [Microcoleus vaginatus]|uniref:hypothetical protein n=1 Tax=Microcoleus vaginatus TaxID=119532 RepID=UPI00403FA545
MTTNNIILSYLGPREIEANRATVLVGSFDKNLVAAISAAEGSNALNVGINLSRGFWHISLEKGFDSAGTRTLQVRATDKTGKVIGQQTINIKVNPASQSPAQFFTLITLRDTAFKVGTLPASNLNNLQKAEIPAGKTYQIRDYELEDGHLNVQLNNPIPPVGTSGFFYEKHVVITKGAKILIFDRAELPTPAAGNAVTMGDKKDLVKAQPHRFRYFRINSEITI